MADIALASSSPRRTAILSSAGVAVNSTTQAAPMQPRMIEQLNRMLSADALTQARDKRIAELGTGSPVLLVVLRKVRASRSFEAWLHDRFAEERQYGEWFRPSPRVLAFIEQVKDHPEMTP